MLAGASSGGRILQEPRRPALARAKCWLTLWRRLQTFLMSSDGTESDLQPPADVQSLILPILPSDRSRLNVHAMLSPLFISGLLLRLQEWHNMQKYWGICSKEWYFSLLQIRPSPQGDGHIRIFGTLEIGDTKYPGVQQLQCWPLVDQLFYGYNRDDFVFVRPPGVEWFVLSPENVWYGRLKLLFKLAVWEVEPVNIECAYVTFCYEIKLEQSVM